jgi:hypothetical protein
LVRHAFDVYCSVQARNTFDDTLKPKMAAAGALSMLGIKTASIVIDGKPYTGGGLPSANLDSRGLPVPDGIDGQFADYAENRVDDVVAKISGFHRKVDYEFGRADDRHQSHAYRVREELLVDGKVSEIPKTVLEVVSAALHHHPDLSQVGKVATAVLFGNQFGSVQL